ncbi:putative 30s ribosomal protein s7 protein [Neofusicoccum parvum UCRNP2]|uniref:Small ribosomal subunit protein uS7m n=1 Tax=Botryosphaeria parva (strain UCR-NP2) TaxID=1287680 RepID=R1EQV8_BOTPV|nr:putative 30s ribosomal protein s7 protein [Neofusicoccum parvum UCRNP2]
MPPRLNLLSAPRSLVLRPRPAAPQWRAHRIVAAPHAARRCYADDAAKKDLPESDDGKGPNMDTLPHVSEEARDIAKMKKVPPPEVEQGTPVNEYVKGDKDAQKHLPQVMKDSLKASSGLKGSRSFSTSAIRREEQMALTQEPASVEPSAEGVKFGVVPFPLPAENRLKGRYDPVVQQVTNLLMQHGKKSVAQRNMALILNHLRTSPPPAINPARPLISGAPPPSHLPLNPVLYLTLAIDSIAPLLRIRSQRGAAGGGMALQIPVPLGLQQRRRKAVEWILEAASKRRNTGSGKGGFAMRFANELVAVVQGTSSIWAKRDGVHKIAVAARANLIVKPKGRK